MSGGIKVDYSYATWQSDPHLTDACDPPLGAVEWYYGHGTYLVDGQSTNDVFVNYCEGCSGAPQTQIPFARHSLSILYSGLITYYQVYNVSGGGAFSTKWQQMSGFVGVLGAPISDWYDVTGGQVQDFEGGSIYWSSTTGTYEVQEAIRRVYIDVWIGPTGVLGFPTSDELGIANGRVSYFYGNLCGSRGPNNSGSAIYYSSATGAHQVGGCIYNKYWHDYGGPGGNSSFNLGFPTSDVQAISGGYVSYFYGNLCSGRGPNNSGSAIYYSSATGGHMVGGCIYNKYWHMNGPSSVLGYPTSDVEPIAGGYVSYFQGGGCGSSQASAIYYSSGYGAHEVQGCIYLKYQQIGGPGGMGFPTTDEQPVYNSSGQLIGRENLFNGAGCSGTGSAVIWSSGTGAHEVHGCIYHAYLGAGGPSGGLGLPVSDEYTNSIGNRESDFQGGYITWDGQAHIHLYGCPSCS